MADANVALRIDSVLNRIFLHLVGDDNGNGAEEYLLSPKTLAYLLSHDLRDILQFAAVNERLREGFFRFVAMNEHRNRRLNRWYGYYSTKFSPISIIPDEVLERVIDFLTLKPTHLMPIAHPASLSVDSFSSTAPYLPEDSTQIQQFVR
jgi:hypothetical protein